MRTSWKVGLATGVADPVPRATPRTNVVLPAPSSPLSRTISPRRSLSPSASPADSVYAGEVVIRSRKVVVAALAQRQVGAVGPDHADRASGGHDPDRVEPRVDEVGLGAYADELGFLSAGKGVLDRGPRRPRHFGRADDAAVARNRGELLHLSQQPVRDVAAAELGPVEDGACFEPRLGEERPALAKRDGRRPQRTAHPHRPSGLHP